MPRGNPGICKSEEHKTKIKLSNIGKNKGKVSWNSGVNNTGTQAVAMGLQARAIEAQVNNTEADTALKMAQAAKEAGEGNDGTSIPIQ